MNGPGGDDGYGSNGGGPPTPPGHVRRLEDLENRHGDLHGKQSRLTNLVHTNHLSQMHEIGQVAVAVMGHSASLAELRNEVAELRKLVEKTNDLVAELSVHLGKT